MKTAKVTALLGYLLLAMSLVGCSLFEVRDELLDPVKLNKITTEVSPKTVYKVSVGKGVNDEFSRLAPMHNGDQLITVDVAGNITAWRKNDGKRIWRQETGLKVQTGVNGSSETILVGAADGTVNAYDAKDGAALWTTSLNSVVMAVSGATDTHAVVRTKNGYIHALELADGEVRWSINREVPPLTLHGQSTPLFYADKVLIGLDNGRLLALSADDGKVLWERAVASGRGSNELDRMVDIDGRFVVENNIAYVSTFQGNVAAINIESGDAIWTQEASSVVGLSTDDDRIYYTDSNDVVWALDKYLGESIWKNEELLRRDLTVPVVHGDYVVAADVEGYLHWFSKEDGRIVARQKTGATVITEPYVSDGLLYVLNTNGSLSVWRLPSS